MKSRFALSIAPILLLVATNQSEAAVKRMEPHHGAEGRSTAAATRHTRSRIALASTRHVKVRHLALHHVKVRSRNIAYARRLVSAAVSETDGWNPAVADISYPSQPIGASVRQAVYTTGGDTNAGQGLAAQAARPIQTGIASYYGRQHNGRRTASGSVFHENALTAAHATLPFGTKVRVEDPETGRAVIVTITDRLHEPHRVIDLSEGAARQLGILREGLAMVTLTPEP